MVEHAGLAHQIGLPGVVEFRVIVGLAGDGRSADVGAVGLGPVQDGLEALRCIQVSAGNLFRTRRPQQETHGKLSLEYGVGPHQGGRREGLQDHLSGGFSHLHLAILVKLLLRSGGSDNVPPRIVQDVVYPQLHVLRIHLRLLEFNVDTGPMTSVGRVRLIGLSKIIIQQLHVFSIFGSRRADFGEGFSFAGCL